MFTERRVSQFAFQRRPYKKGGRNKEIRRKFWKEETCKI